MSKNLKSLLVNPLIIGSFFLFSGGVIANLFNFLFNLFMSRNLKIEDYGTLISLVSIITLLSIPATAITPTIVSVAGEYFAKKDFAHAKALYLKILKGLALLGIIVTFIFIIFSNILGDFFQIDPKLLLMATAPIIALAYGVTLNNTFIQAKLSFKTLSFINALSSFAKLSTGVLLVLLGWSLCGAIFGVFASYLLPVVVSLFFLRKVIFYKSYEEVKISFRKLLDFGLPSAVVVFSLAAFISTDILLAKHLFTEFTAGQYAGLSLVGRVIFFVTAPVSTVMYPIIINRHSSNKKYLHILFLALLLVAGASLFATAFYYIFPSFTILFFLKNEDYLPTAQYLGLFGLFITVYSLLTIMAYYYLSIKQTRIWRFLLLGVVLQALLIYFIHDSFYSIIVVSLTIVTILLTLLLVNLKFKKSLFA